ncbi:MDR family MFS transporter [Tsukamurella ocularis]|uniref:MDR family MFS transporter n=1 Tax=Tsukamurella ocularis TaxID=1970234 RepID=UPI00286DFE70|nr:DHA2 family efflux MFS transporter permease subunit [Tsukamurella ocularis]MCS3780230.1 EmrB/QacA subfamily drug resistance transporter [Tsukamurella ocularis]MCS3786216.1 EmrB/QacA subfamily drug resistance transporter [Tsukamurella ocularis]MCS3849580.1 EmrB/QacA subfamily drug resistance transporter [Tsukamurella ocularis]
MTSAMAPGAPAQTYRVKGSALGVAIVVLSGMMFLAVLDGTVVFVALPRIQDAMHLSDAAKIWVFGAYAVTFGGFMLLGGRLGDTFGRKRMFILGVAGFTLASLLTGFATNEAWLLVARAGQGLFAAIACPTALALIATTFAPGKARNQAFAIFGAMAGLGSVSGLVAGGLLATWDWRFVFWINVPVGIVCVIGAVIALEESTSERRHALDIKGAFLAVAGCVAGVYALTMGPESHWQGATIYVAAAVSAVCLVAFLVVERTAKNPILPFSLFHNRNRVAAMVAILVCGALIPTLGFYVALTFQQVLGYTPLQSGLALIPFAVGMGIAAPISSKLALKIQARWLVAIGGVIVFLPCIYVPTLMTKDPSAVSYFPYIGLPVFLIGLGVGFAMIPLPICALAGVRPSETGPMSALVEVCQNIGGIVGLASVQVLVTSRIMKEGGPTKGEITHEMLDDAQRSALASGYGLAFIACAAILILAGLVVVPFMRFTPEEVAEGQAAQESSKSGGSIPSTSFPAQAFEDDDDVDDDWEPLEGDVTSGSFPAVRREDFDRAYNERPGDPEPVYFTDRFRAIKRPQATGQQPVQQPLQHRPATQPPQAAPVAQQPQQAYSHPSDPLPRTAQSGEGLAGVARPSGPIQRESTGQPRPPQPPRPAADPQYRPPVQPPQGRQRPSTPIQRPSGQMHRPSAPIQRPSGQMPRPSGPVPGPPGQASPPLQRPSGAIQRPGRQAPPQPGGPGPRLSDPVQRPSAPIQRPPAAPQSDTPSNGGRHALPEPDAMHHPEASAQAERVSRARRHRLDED